MSDVRSSAALRMLLETPSALALATVDDAGHPHATYAPFAIADGAIVVALSTLAAHGRHLRARSDASLLLVEEALSGQDAYARARITLAVNAFAIAEDARRDAAWDALGKRHGATIAVLAGLPDFTLFACAPSAGRMVLGFAAAYDIDAPALAAALRAAA